MSSSAVQPPPNRPAAMGQTSPRAGKRFARTRQSVAATSLAAQGEPMIWLTGGALAIAVIMIVGLLLLVVYQGLCTFWPLPVERVVTDGGAVYLGEVETRQRFVPSEALLASLPAGEAQQVRQQMAAGGGQLEQENLRIENFELSNEHFVWIDEFRIQESSLPEWALTVERLTNGRFYGTPVGFLLDGKEVADTPEMAWAKFREYHAAARRQANDETDRDAQLRYQIRMETADGKTALLPLAGIVRAYPANQLGMFGRLGVYLSRWREFLCDAPREANSEGGVFPAIFGTVVMTLLMSVAVVPFGVLAALYLREYAKPGPVVSAVRIAINNLAGVPSIVFGVFGLGFFCYFVGGQIDRLFFAAHGSSVFGTPGILWASLTLALLTLPVVIITTEEALAAVPSSMREGSYACGASKWQTVHRIVLPRAMPGIMTGMILAMARGAGEVAPLMLVGAMKTVPELPVDTTFPYVHAQRAFMHLGYHIFDLGFHSQNSVAAVSMVFTTTLLLVAIVAALNITAIWLRGRLRRRFVASHF
ncbi:MAG TPA: phosphate ABC transporter permease PstA [Pirellulales bacterium]|nr:phosphate ABC transporter permease PstA [Pirellulales bacterium]